MPIYEYVCGKCNQITEKLQRFDDPPLKTCSSCGGRLKKIVSNTSFVLKGGGWYKDGYSSTGDSSASGGNGKGASQDKKKDTTNKAVSKTENKNKAASAAA